MEGIQFRTGGSEREEEEYTQKELEKIRERLAVLDEKIKKDAREIIEVLRVDFPSYIEREIKRRFVNSPGFSEGLSDETIKQIKQGIAAQGEKVVQEVIPALEDWEIWFPMEEEDLKSETNDLKDNPRVWGHIQKVGAYVYEIFQKHGFPGVEESDYRDAYSLPTWFIAGRLIKSLVEAYWRNMHEYRSLNSVLTKLGEKEKKEHLAERWDAL